MSPGGGWIPQTLPSFCTRIPPFVPAKPTAGELVKGGRRPGLSSRLSVGNDVRRPRAILRTRTGGPV